VKSAIYSLLLASPVLALPEGYEISTWAEPFEIEYPAAITAAADGTVYVSCDRNGSLGKDKDVGKVVACRDTDGDGKADRFIDFVPKIDSPRGGHFVRDTLYLIHPPFLSSFRDTTGDGVADEHKVLLENLGVGLRHPRGSDHTTNGCRMGIDGWLYIAVGDFGMEATKGTDGRVVTLHGGGVARVRPDGSELEVFSYHTRNICDVAISPQLDLFSRDNTNDGKGWNIRVHHHTSGVDHGYPRLYKNFTAEGVTPLFDGGGGSGTGALYLAEPGHEEMLLTCDWTTGKIYHDKLTSDGASFTLEESVFLDLERAVDIDVDGESNLYVCDWRGGRFRFAGEGVKVGLIQKLTKKGLKVEKFPDLTKMSNADLVKQFESPSAVRRLETQREILARGGDEFKKILVAGILTDNGSASGIAKLFTLSQLNPKGWKESLWSGIGVFSGRPRGNEMLIRALVDRDGDISKRMLDAIRGVLNSDDERLQLQSAVALMRLGREAVGSSSDILKVAASTKDERLHHTAIQALVAIAEVDVLLAATDQAAALQALQRLHEPVVASSLIAQLGGGENALPLIGALSRLYHKEGEWDLKAWWGTRPDDRGPYFYPTIWSETPSIKKALEVAYADLSLKEQKVALEFFSKNRIPLSDLDLGEQDPFTFALMSPDPEKGQLKVLSAAARDSKREWDVRLEAHRACMRSSLPEALREQALILGTWLSEKGEAEDVVREVGDFVNLNSHQLRIKDLRQIAKKEDAQTSRVAWKALLTLTQSPLVKEKLGEQAMKAAKANPREEGFFFALADLKLAGFDKQIQNAINSDNDTLIEAAKHANKVIAEAKASGGKMIAQLKAEDVMKLAMSFKGDPKRGQELYTRQGCIACHAVDQAAVQKGPYLGSAGSKFSRDYLIQSILDPNAVVAQGFQTELVTLNDGTAHLGFVTREEDGIVDLRDIAGAVKQLKESDIKKRDHQATSMMPPGLASGLTVEQFIDLIDYLGSLKEGGK
jgi:putative heme-binding domain-containing protein